MNRTRTIHMPLPGQLRPGDVAVEIYDTEDEAKDGLEEWSEMEFWGEDVDPVVQPLWCAVYDVPEQLVIQEDGGRHTYLDGEELREYRSGLARKWAVVITPTPHDPPIPNRFFLEDCTREEV